MMAAPLAGPGALDDAALPVHPRTGLTAVGIVRGKPVWPIQGGSGEGEGGGGNGGQASTGTQQQSDQQTGQQQAGSGTQQPQQQAGQQQSTQQQDVNSLPDWAQKLVTDLRTENANRRTTAQTATQQAQTAQQQRDAVLKAMGLTADGKDAPPDVDTLTAQIEQQQAVAWTAAVELNVFRTAQAAGADGEKLLDSRAFIDSLDEFTEADPAAPDFRQKLGEHIKAYVEKHPQFKTQPQNTPPGKNGSDRAPGGSGGTRQPVKGLGSAIRAHYGG